MCIHLQAVFLKFTVEQKKVLSFKNNNMILKGFFTLNTMPLSVSLYQFIFLINLVLFSAKNCKRNLLKFLSLQHISENDQLSKVFSMLNLNQLTYFLYYLSVIVNWL